MSANAVSRRQLYHARQGSAVRLHKAPSSEAAEREKIRSQRLTRGRVPDLERSRSSSCTEEPASFHNDCLWSLSRERGVAATSFDDLVKAGIFTLGWYQVENKAAFLLGCAKELISRGLTTNEKRLQNSNRIRSAY